ncbi:hypothetical protein HDU84_000948, partial [Entophlyctis sp. JEL0112]
DSAETSALSRRISALQSVAAASAHEDNDPITAFAQKPPIFKVEPPVATTLLDPIQFWANEVSIGNSHNVDLFFCP